MRKLESVASTRHTVMTAASRKRRMWEEVILCIVFPLAMLPLLYVVQGHRYRLIESLGPGGVPVHFSWPGLVLAYILPSLVALASLVYAGECSNKSTKVLAETLRLGCAMVSGPSTAIQINPGGIRLALNSRSLPSAHRIGRWRQLPSAVQRGFPARSRLLRPIPVRILRIHQLGHSPRGILGHLAISRGDTCAIRIQQFHHQFLYGTDIFIPLLHLLWVGRRGDI
jgi:hypothetical protein